MINTGNKASHEVPGIDSSTVTELWKTLESDFDEFPEISRPSPIGLTSTSRKLARNWQAILDDASTSQHSTDHYLSDSQIVSLDSSEIESGFAVALATFLVGQLTERVQEMRQAQLQLQDELARFSLR